MAAAAPPPPPRGNHGSGELHRKTGGAKANDVRTSNIIAAKAVSDALRTSLGPKGMDKMIQGGKGDVLITNDGATILQKFEVFHPTAKMLVQLSQSQDVEAGDGTTSVVVIAGSLLQACLGLLTKGIHPTRITESFRAAALEAEKVLTRIATPVDLSDRQQLVDAAVTSLNSKVISEQSGDLAPMAVDAVLRVIDPAIPDNVNLDDIRIVKQVGGTIDDTELVDGLVLGTAASHAAGGPTRAANAKIGLVQFCISAPKTDVENQVVVSEYSAMDRILREERKYILGMCKKIKASGCNVLLVQKSILRDSVTDLTLHFLAKMKIVVVRDVEREDVEFISRSLNLTPVAHIDQFTADKLGHADLFEEISAVSGGSKVCKVTGIKDQGNTTSIICRGSNGLVLEEAERSLHDALCVVRAIVKKRYLISGGGAPESEVFTQLSKWSNTLRGTDQYCARAFAEALEIIPYTLAENAGLHPVHIVTELRKRHAEGDHHAGINVKKGMIDDMKKQKVIQPLLVSTSALSLATETVMMILKIDDLVASR